MLDNTVVHLRVPRLRPGPLEEADHLLCSARHLQRTVERLTRLHHSIRELTDGENVDVRVGLSQNLKLPGAVLCDHAWWKRWHVHTDTTLPSSQLPTLRTIELTDAQLQSPRDLRTSEGWTDASTLLRLQAGPLLWSVGRR
jgi:hypothetical protein